MGAAEDLMQRLAVSKKIMDRSEEIKGGNPRKINMPMVEDYQPVQATYNLPQEFLSETTTQIPTHDPTKPLETNRIMSSKLPDEIKALMIEQPIVQPSSMNGNSEISEEIIQGAQRLMNMGVKNNPTTTQKQQQPQQNRINENTNQSGSFNMNEMKSIIRDVVRDTVRDVVREELKEAGMLVESTQNSNETIQFKVGQHLFIGKVLKVKKLQK
jgi:hypothetical protein